jgi:hypothetical protein
MRLAAAVAIGAMVFVAPASAQPSHTLAENFVGICLLNEARQEPVISLAQVGQWQALDPAYYPLIAPAEEPLSFSAWTVENGGDLFIAAISTAEMDGRIVPSCAVAGQANQVDVLAMLDKFGARLITDDDEFVQRARTFQVDRLNNRLLVVMTTGPDEAQGFVSLAVLDSE